MRTPSIAALGLCVALASCGNEPPKNVLLIVVDGLRADALSSSSGAANMPNLRALAGDGVSFASCFAHSPATSPAVASILSGRNPRATRLRATGQNFDASVELVAQQLRDSGWATFASVASNDLRRGTARVGLDGGFEIYCDSDADVVRAADVEKPIASFLASASVDRPWFMLAEYADPTAPWEALGVEKNEAELVVDGAAVESIVTSDAASPIIRILLSPGEHEIVLRSRVPFVARRLTCEIDGEVVEPEFTIGAPNAPANGIAFTVRNHAGEPRACVLDMFLHDAPSLAQVRARYKREIEAVDRSIGALVSALKERGEYENTCIVVTGAHGTALGEHGLLGDTGALFDESLRVPLVVKPPHGFERRSDLARAASEIARHIDIVPTVLDLVDEGVLEGADGSTLLERIERPLVAEAHAPDATSTKFAHRDERYKLVYDRAHDHFEMFDLRTDTLEVENVFELQGHFRQAWQTELRRLADDAPTTAMAAWPASAR